MKKYIFCIALLFLLVFNTVGKAQVFTFGPMLHVNLGTMAYFSLGLEGAIWVNFWSVDGGLEYGLGKTGKNYRRRYIELQTFLPKSLAPNGPYINGVSAGYVFEKNKATDSISHGFQASIWSAMFAGADFRIRIVGGSFTLSPGLFFKYPVYPFISYY